MDKSVNIGIIPLSIPGHQSGLEFAQKNWESHQCGPSLTIDSNFLTWCCVFGASHKIDHHLDMNPALQPNSSNGINAVPGQGSIMRAFLAQFVGCKRVGGGATFKKHQRPWAPSRKAISPNGSSMMFSGSFGWMISSIWSWNPDVLRYPKEVWGPTSHQSSKIIQDTQEAFLLSHAGLHMPGDACHTVHGVVRTVGAQWKDGCELVHLEPCGTGIPGIGQCLRKTEQLRTIEPFRTQKLRAFQVRIQKPLFGVAVFLFGLTLHKNLFDPKKLRSRTPAAQLGISETRIRDP